MSSKEKKHPQSRQQSSRTKNEPDLIAQGAWELFRYLVDHIGDEVLVVDSQSRIVLVNKAAIKGMGYSKKNILNHKLTDFLEDKMSVKKWKRTYFQEIKKKKKPVSYTINRVVKGKKVRTIDMTASYMPYETREYVLNVGRDITEQLSFQNKIKESEDRDIKQKKEMEDLIKQSEKMEALQHFIVGTTHEIQQPLKGLLDHSQALIDRYKDRHFEYIGFKEFKDIMRTLQTMNDQVKYCFDTTDRLNTLNRKKVNLQDASSNVNHVIRQTVNMLKHSLEVSEIKAQLSLKSDLPHAAISTLELGQALNNILTNAIQSLPGIGGSIRIKTDYLKSVDKVSIEIHDDGVGIPKEVLKRVFDPFFTTKPRGLEKSSGLGLYIVYTIIKDHKGTISVKSNYRKGTHVTITLPVHKQKKKSKTAC